MSCVFKHHVGVIVAGLVDCDVSDINVLGRLETVTIGGDVPYFVIGQPSVSDKLISVYNNLSLLGHRVFYLRHPREEIAGAVECLEGSSIKYNTEAVYIGGFSTLLLELVESGCSNLLV